MKIGNLEVAVNIKKSDKIHNLLNEWKVSLNKIEERIAEEVIKNLEVEVVEASENENDK